MNQELQILKIPSQVKKRRLIIFNVIMQNSHLKRDLEKLKGELEEKEDKFEISSLECENLKESISKYHRENLEYRTILDNGKQEIQRLRSKLKIIEDYKDQIEKLNNQLKIKSQESAVNAQAILNLENVIENLQVEKIIKLSSRRKIGQRN